jgi:hypothetical protein
VPPRLSLHTALQATTFEELKELYDSYTGWSDVEGFLKFFNLYPAQLNLSIVQEVFK